MEAIMTTILLGVMFGVPVMILIALTRHMDNWRMVLKKVIIVFGWGFLIFFFISMVLAFLGWAGR